MNWKLRYATSKVPPKCVFCHGPSHYFKTAREIINEDNPEKFVPGTEGIPRQFWTETGSNFMHMQPRPRYAPVPYIQDQEANPEHMVTVYRAVPKSVDTIYHGDQVTTDPVRALHVAARTDGLSSTLAAQDKETHVLTTKIPAKHLISSLGTGMTPDGFDPDNITRWTDYGYFPKG